MKIYLFIFIQLLNNALNDGVFHDQRQSRMQRTNKKEFNLRLEDTKN